MYDVQYNDKLNDTIEQVLREELNVCHDFAQAPNYTIKSFKEMISEKAMNKLSDTQKKELKNSNLLACAIDHVIYLLPSERDDSIIVRFSR